MSRPATVLHGLGLSADIVRDADKFASFVETLLGGWG